MNQPASDFQLLNPEQQRAVTTIDGPVLVIAGPGTGKTQILAHRIAYILEQTDTSTENILCLTYTDAGTVAMKQRLLRYIGPEAHRISVHTFHGFCNRVIQERPEEFNHRNLQPLNDLERYQYLHDLAINLPQDHPLKKMKGNVTYLVQSLNRLFGWMKKENISPQKLEQMCTSYKAEIRESDAYIYKRAYKDNPAGSLNMNKIEKEDQKANTLMAAGHLYAQYEDRKHQEGTYDFDDMILWVLELFEREQAVLSDYQELFHYVLVDEYQDTSGSQNDLINALVSFWEENPNLFVVGDDDQSIYRFQGAEIENILQFNSRYQAFLKHIVLKTNYRSTASILHASAAHISENTNRLINLLPNLSKDLTPADLSNTGHPVLFTSFPSAHMEGVGIAQQIQALIEQGVNPEDIAVLYRQHKQGEPLAQLLKHLGIPVFMQRKENILHVQVIQQVLNALKFISQELERPYSGEHHLFSLLHLDVFNRSPLDIARFSHAVFQHRLKWRDALNEPEKLLDGSMDLVHMEAWKYASSLLENLIKKGANEPLIQLIYHVIHDLQISKGSLLNSFELECLHALIDFAENECASKPDLSLRDFLKKIDLMDEYRIALNRQRLLFDDKGVNFMTAHGSKGLEFDHVFMIDCSANSWEKEVARSPYGFAQIFKSEEIDNSDEHRRLFYVAMTRARKTLRLSAHEQSNSGKDILHSSFIDELLNQNAIEHQSFEPDPSLALQLLQVIVSSPEMKPEHLLDTQRIQNYLESYQLSVSHLNEYLECPTSFYFSTILRVPKAKNKYLSFGIAVHRTLDQLFKSMVTDPSSIDTFKAAAAFERNLIRERYVFTEKEFEDFMSLGQNALTMFVETRKDEWKSRTDMRSEVTFERIVVDQTPVKGTLDLIDVTNHQADVFDFKTGNPQNARLQVKPPADGYDGTDKTKQFGGKYWRQMMFYALLIESDKRLNLTMQRGVFDFVEPDDDKNFVREYIDITPEGKTFMRNLIHQVYTRIRQADFLQGCGEENCEWCAFVANHANKS